MLLSGAAAAEFPTLGEDEARRSMVQRDEGVAAELVTAYYHFFTDTQYERSSGADINNSGVGVDGVHVAVHLHLVRALGVSFGVFHLRSGGAGIDVVRLSGGGVGGRPGSLSITGPMMGVEANPIGFGNVGTSIGVDLMIGPFVPVYYAGLRLEFKNFRISPRISYADFHYSHPDYSIGTNYAWGWGAGVQIGFRLGSTEP